MSPSRRRFNPFYLLVVLSGVAFTITASAYGWMVYVSRQAQPEVLATASRSGLFQLLRQHGTPIVAGELAVLILAALAAMATDRFWSRSDESSERKG